MTRRRLTVVSTISVVLLGAIAVSAAIYFAHRAASPFPPESEIERIEAHLIDLETAKFDMFDVPRAYWPAIFSAMQPAQRDDHPLKWTGNGYLILKLRNAPACRIDIYIVEGEQGAFALEPTGGPRVYYRGGDSTDLQNALAKARKASKAGH